MKENTVGRFILPEFKIYSKAIVVKFVLAGRGLGIDTD